MSFHILVLGLLVILRSTCYFLSKVNIWNFNCAWATAFIFDSRRDVLVKALMFFWDRKCLDLRVARTPNPRIHAQCSNHLSYQGQTFAVSIVTGMTYICRKQFPVLLWPLSSCGAHLLCFGSSVIVTSIVSLLPTAADQSHSLSCQGQVWGPLHP